MKFKVFVKSTEDYAQWKSDAEAAIKKTAAAAAAATGTDSSAAPANTLADQGKQLFLSEGCVNCHTIAGLSTPNIGPDLTRISQRAMLGAGVLPNSKENLAKWLSNPQTYKPGCKMPDFKFTDKQVDQLVAFLESLN